MSLSGVSGRTSYLTSGLINIKDQLDFLTQQLASGKKSTTYSGLGIDSATATGLRSQLAMLASYADTDNMLNTRIGVANLSLQGIIDAGSEVKSAAAGATLDLDSTGQTPGQRTAQASFTQVIALLNSSAGGRYLFSGRATDAPATESADVIMNGRGNQAGLKKLIDERAQADGTSGLGRLNITAPSATSPTTVSIAEDAYGSKFGLKLKSATADFTGVTGPADPPAPAPTPPQASFDFSTRPKDGDKVTLTFSLPDGTSEKIELTASTADPLPEGSFKIGATPEETANNFNDALNTSVGKLANTALVAASAVQASNEFFTNPPQRVDGPPFDTATALKPGTPDDTVFWYTGEDGTDPARGTAVVGVDSSISVQYGARANEEAFVTQLKNIAVYAAVTTDAKNPNANGQITALNSRIVDNLSVQPGEQTVQNIQADFAAAQSAAKSAKDRQTQIGAVAQSMLDSIQGINDDEVAAKIMALQTSLQASYQTTSSLYQLSLVKFMT